MSSCVESESSYSSPSICYVHMKYHGGVNGGVKQARDPWTVASSLLCIHVCTLYILYVSTVSLCIPACQCHLLFVVQVHSEPAVHHMPTHNSPWT